MEMEVWPRWERQNADAEGLWESKKTRKAADCGSKLVNRVGGCVVVGV